MVFFTKSKVAQFSVDLARELARRYSPAMEKGEDRKISAKGISNILEEIYEKAVDFKKKEKLWFMQTAKLSNCFRWELKELGYSDAFIDVATEGLVVYLTRKSKTSTPSNQNKNNSK